MNKSSYLLRLGLFLVFMFSNVLFAQEITSPFKFSLYGGASLPTGDFSSTAIAEKSGYATTGFCAMIEGSKEFGETINWISSVSLAINGFDESTLESQLGGLSVSADNYITTWIMTGAGLETPLAPMVNFYALAQIGLLVSSVPDITISYGGESITQTTNTGTAFAYGFGAGIKITKLNIGMRYYSGEPEYEQTASYNGVTGTNKIKLPASIIELLVGLNF